MSVADSESVCFVESGGGSFYVRDFSTVKDAKEAVSEFCTNSVLCSENSLVSTQDNNEKKSGTNNQLKDTFSQVKKQLVTSKSSKIEVKQVEKMSENVISVDDNFSENVDPTSIIQKINATKRAQQISTIIDKISIKPIDSAKRKGTKTVDIFLLTFSFQN